MGNAVVALDIGTTALKAALFTETGKIMALERAPTPSSSPKVGWLEHDPESLWIATLAILKRVVTTAGDLGVQPRAIAVTGARGTVCLTDGAGAALTPFITWQDRRSLDVLPLLRERLGGDVALYRQTGVRLDPSIIGPKLYWLREHSRSIVDRARWAATTQGFAVHRLTGTSPMTDVSTANYFGLIDLGSAIWSEELVEKFDIPANVLPPLASPGTVAGPLGARAAHALGLTPGIDVVLAGSDGVCAELGAGVVQPAQVYGYLGSAAAAASPILEPRVDPSAGLLVSPGSVEGRWRVLAISIAGASAADWWRTIAAMDEPSRLDSALDMTEPGARGVVFMPTLSGAGTPYWAPHARGAFLGLSLSHSAADLARAVCEGVAIDIRTMVSALRLFGVTPEELRLTGGGARSDRWAQLIANVLQLPIARVDHPEPGLLGNACYALASTGTFPDVLAAATELRAPAKTFEPDPGLAGVYAEAASTYDLARRAFAESHLDQKLASSKG